MLKDSFYVLLCVALWSNMLLCVAGFIVGWLCVEGLILRVAVCCIVE